MEEVINEFRDTVGPYLPRVAGALAIIIIGWLLAHVASRVVRSRVRRARLDGALADLLGGSEGPAGAERAAGAVTFWIGMLLVAGAALEALALDQVSEPLNESLNEVFAFLPACGRSCAAARGGDRCGQVPEGARVARPAAWGVDRRLGEQAGGERRSASPPQ